jgi:4-cresol dehydrogenase (hydroxylating) flavoprotein subunit
VLGEAMARIREVVGEKYVVLEPDGVRQRAKDIIPFVRNPVAYVYPGGTEEVQRIVRIANKYGMPLWPCSKGKNWGYGAATPAQDGAVVLVLERMSRIIEVNQTLAYALVEPGVTYRQLHDYLIRNGIRLWLDCTDGPADGSVMGNALERGVGETPYGDHFENICGMELVLPTGELVRTGGGSMENYRSWNTHKWGVGPYLEGLFSQSNYGIVTKMGIWLMPEPESFLSCVFELRDERDFPAVIDAMRRLAFTGALRSKVHMINDITMFGIVTHHPRELLQGEPFLSDQRRAELRKQFNIAPWTFGAGLYGTPARIRADRALIKKELARYGGVQFISDRKNGWIECFLRCLEWLRANGYAGFAERIARGVSGKPFGCLETLPHIHAIEKGKPSDYFVKHAYLKARRPKPPDHDIDPARDGCGGIWAGVMVPLEGEEVRGVVELCQRLAHKHRMDLTLALMVASPRSVIILTSIFFEKQDAEETARAEELYFAIGEETQAAGYQQYRTSTIFMDRILRPAPEFRGLARTIKEALDPRNVLAPGKYGIN